MSYCNKYCEVNDDLIMVQANPHSRIHGGHLAMDIPFLARIPYIGLDLEIIHEPPMSVQHKRRT